MELPVHLSKESRVPIYHQIAGQIQAMIASGQLAPGAPLPSIRTLSKDLEISAITTRRAYQDLELEGFITTIQGKGTFVEKVEESLIRSVKIKSVQQAMDKSIESALQQNYTFEEIETIFAELIEELKMKKGGKG
ncbi:GntR family transcriptional regulator [Peribacillus frigoritolerans]|uniref:GntR family transcriptional regulator n=1 Tax=Peribacillus frigoritolerans TaxID=450367 RepID=UPI0023DAFFCF|nr:GntR family transcriptional regulator [Peribacillus frigoritolerans]MDF1997766.1 GntR family transcriptional regulator [Peribacillus frigoritolerans]